MCKPVISTQLAAHIRHFCRYNTIFEPSLLEPKYKLTFKCLQYSVSLFPTHHSAVHPLAMIDTTAPSTADLQRANLYVRNAGFQDVGAIVDVLSRSFQNDPLVNYFRQAEKVNPFLDC